MSKVINIEKQEFFKNIDFVHPFFAQQCKIKSLYSAIVAITFFTLLFLSFYLMPESKSQEVPRVFDVFSVLLAAGLVLLIRLLEITISFFALFLLLLMLNADNIKDFKDCLFGGLLCLLLWLLSFFIDKFLMSFLTSNHMLLMLSSLSLSILCVSILVDNERIKFMRIPFLKESFLSPIFVCLCVGLALLLVNYIHSITGYSETSVGKWIMIFALEIGILAGTLNAIYSEDNNWEAISFRRLLYESLSTSIILFVVGMLLGMATDVNTIANGIFMGSTPSLLGVAAVVQHFILRLLLTFSGNIPLNTTRFLDDCTDHLILQRIGNRYRFIHRLVQEHFANLEVQKQ